jgi:Fe-S-cluster containining protein
MNTLNLLLIHSSPCLFSQRLANSRRMSVTALCQACGLCCDGTLFSVVPLTPDDRPPASLAIDLRPSGARALRQPCTALSGTCCTVYEQRPLACRRYQCLLFEALASHEEHLAGALGIVARAKALTAAVVPSLEAARTEAARPGAPPPPALAQAEAFLKFHFLGHRR